MQLKKCYFFVSKYYLVFSLIMHLSELIFFDILGNVSLIQDITIRFFYQIYV